MREPRTRGPGHSARARRPPACRRRRSFHGPAPAPPRRTKTGPRACAANDDRASIGQVLQALQRRPTRTPYVIAGLFSAAWIVCALGLSYGYLGEFATLYRQGGSAVPLAGRAGGRVLRADRLLLRPRPHAGALAGAAHHRPVDGRGRDPPRRAGDASRTIPSSASARRSAARSPRWATASSARSRAPPSSKPWSTTRSPRSSAPTTTTSCASAPCSTDSPRSARPWSARPSRCATPSPTSISTSRTTSPR